MGRNGSQSITRMRLERLVDERARIEANMGDALRFAEDEQRELNELEKANAANWREQLAGLDSEIELLTGDLERETSSRDVSAALRRADEGAPVELEEGGVVYRTFAAYARDEILSRFPIVAAQAASDRAGSTAIVERARENLARLERVQNTLTSDIAGLLPPTHLAQIMDLIAISRPVVNSARQVNLDRGSLTYPKITGRP